MLASRFPIKQRPAAGLLHQLGRWLHVKVEGIEVMLMHVPNSSANKWQFHEEAVAQFEKYQSVPAIAMGDTNTGQHEIDEENKFFNKREDNWFDSINSVGWVDVWRDQNPDKREFTYYHHGRTGFRLDQIFAPNHFAANVTNIYYDWGRRRLIMPPSFSMFPLQAKKIEVGVLPKSLSQVTPTLDDRRAIQ